MREIPAADAPVSRREGYIVSLGSMIIALLFAAALIVPTVSGAAARAERRGAIAAWKAAFDPAYHAVTAAQMRLAQDVRTNASDGTLRADCSRLQRASDDLRDRPVSPDGEAAQYARAFSSAMSAFASSCAADGAKAWKENKPAYDIALVLKARLDERLRLLARA